MWDLVFLLRTKYWLRGYVVDTKWWEMQLCRSNWIFSNRFRLNRTAAILIISLMVTSAENFFICPSFTALSDDTGGNTNLWWLRHLPWKIAIAVKILGLSGVWYFHCGLPWVSWPPDGNWQYTVLYIYKHTVSSPHHKDLALESPQRWISSLDVVGEQRDEEHHQPRRRGADWRRPGGDISKGNPSSERYKARQYSTASTGLGWLCSACFTT